MNTMKKTLLKVALAAMLLALPVQAFALTLEWDRNTETDMKEYNVYGCDTRVCGSKLVHHGGRLHRSRAGSHVKQGEASRRRRDGTPLMMGGASW